MVSDRLSFLLVCTDTVGTGSGYFTGHQHNIFHNLFFIHILDAVLLNICYDPMFAAFKSTEEFCSVEHFMRNPVQHKYTLTVRYSKY